MRVYSLKSRRYSYIQNMPALYHISHMRHTVTARNQSLTYRIYTLLVAYNHFVHNIFPRTRNIRIHTQYIQSFRNILPTKSAQNRGVRRGPRESTTHISIYIYTYIIVHAVRVYRGSFTPCFRVSSQHTQHTQTHELLSQVYVYIYIVHFPKERSWI